jgi:hypothetical protein
MDGRFYIVSSNLNKISNVIKLRLSATGSILTEQEFQKSLNEKRLSFDLPVLITHPLMPMRDFYCEGMIFIRAANCHPVPFWSIPMKLRLYKVRLTDGGHTVAKDYPVRAGLNL